MQISSRFTIANHILVLLATEGETSKQTSHSIATSVGVNPVIIRNILAQLKQAGLVVIARGIGGAHLARSPRTINLLQVYQAVELLGQQGNLFAFHEQPNPSCPVGKNIHHLLDKRLEDAQKALENHLACMTIADLIEEL